MHVGGQRVPAPRPIAVRVKNERLYIESVTRSVSQTLQPSHNHRTIQFVVRAAEVRFPRPAVQGHSVDLRRRGQPYRAKDESLPGGCQRKPLYLALPIEYFDNGPVGDAGAIDRLRTPVSGDEDQPAAVRQPGERSTGHKHRPAGDRTIE